MTDAPRINVVELTVSELSAALKRTIEEGFGYVRVRGELGNVKYHSSGHIYLDLKDDKASLAGVIWRNGAPRIKIKLEAGLEVVVTGRITTYPGRSQYQIVIETLEPAGLGALMALLEERKKKLAADGLFAEARKQLLPFLPDVIGVVTSPTGAVIRDILHRLADRFPRRVLLWPVKVQGDGAAEQIAAAIHGFNALPQGGRIPRPDVLIVARGGGSLEDLWCFNEEIVVRAAAESMIPLISAVGHETDVTLIDFAADRRAPTPTAAAEMAVPVRSELMTLIARLGSRQVACWQRGLEERRKELRALARALPKDILQTPRQRLDGLAERLPRALRANAQIHHMQLSRVATRFTPQLLSARLSRAAERLGVLGDRGQRAQSVLLLRHRDRVKATGQLLAAFSYRGVLARGFALVRDAKGQPLHRAAEVTSGARLDIEFSDGRVGAVAEGTAEPQTKPRPRKPGRSEQGSLF
jgi:exodeoxyribonuclease VII large subunit